MTKKPRIRRWFNNENDVTMFRGDCLKLLKSIPDETVQLIVTSPPYNIGKPSEGKLDIVEYLTFLRKVIDECVRITKEGGSICWQVGHLMIGKQDILPLDMALHPFFLYNEKLNDLRLRNRIVWHFEQGLHCKKRVSGRYETILWYTKGDDYFFNLDALRVPQKYSGKRAYRGSNRGEYSENRLGKNPGDVWIFPNVKGKHIEKTIHPCQFPVELPGRLILALTKPGEIVLDPFLGVGTTAVAAILLNRKAVGAEEVADYFDIARERIKEAFAGTLCYRSLGKPGFKPGFRI
jgi:adenine-specific DNA-methyltransferase